MAGDADTNTGDELPPYPDIGKSTETADAAKLEAEVLQKCPTLPKIADKEDITACMEKIKKSSKEEFQKGSFTIQCMCRIAITILFSSIFSGSKSNGTIEIFPWKRYENKWKSLSMYLCEINNKFSMNFYSDHKVA